MDDEDFWQRVNFSLLGYLPPLLAVVAREKLAIRQHLELEEFVQALVETDTLQVVSLLEQVLAGGKTNWSLEGSPAELALRELFRVADRQRQDELCFVTDLWLEAGLADDAITNDTLEHICDHRLVTLFKSLLASAEVLKLVDARLVRVDQTLLHGLIELRGLIDVFIGREQQA